MSELIGLRSKPLPLKEQLADAFLRIQELEEENNLLTLELKKLKEPHGVSFRLAFGAKWDAGLNPHCMSCNSPLSHSVMQPGAMKCPRCNVMVRLRTDDGGTLTLAEAKSLLQRPSS